jgi:hypothetical protein
MLLPGSSWLHPNVPNAGGKGQPSRCAREPFRHFGRVVQPTSFSPDPRGMPPGPPVDWPDPGAWCNGSTTGSGPVSRGSNPCAPAPRVSDLCPRASNRRAGPPTPRRGSSRTRPGSARLRFVSRHHRPMSTWDVHTPNPVRPYSMFSDRRGRELEISARSFPDVLVSGRALLTAVRVQEIQDR